MYLQDKAFVPTVPPATGRRGSTSDVGPVAGTVDLPSQTPVGGEAGGPLTDMPSRQDTPAQTGHAPSGDFAACADAPATRPADGGLPDRARERSRFVGGIRQALEDRRVTPGGELLRLLSLCDVGVSFATSETWERCASRLRAACDQAMQAQGRVPAVIPRERAVPTQAPACAGIEIKPISLYGRNGLQLRQLTLWDGRQIQAFTASLDAPECYHERQVAAECTLSVANMFNAYRCKTLLGLSTEGELRAWLRLNRGTEQTGYFDTVQVCSFNNEQPGEGRQKLRVANVGLAHSGAILGIVDQEFEEMALDVFDDLDAVGIVLLMPNPAVDSPVRSSLHTVMLCRTPTGRFQVRDPRHGGVLAFDARNMGAAIGQCRRRIGVPGNAPRSNQVEVIYPAPREDARTSQGSAEQA